MPKEIAHVLAKEKIATNVSRPMKSLELKRIARRKKRASRIPHPRFRSRKPRAPSSALILNTAIELIEAGTSFDIIGTYLAGVALRYPAAFLPLLRRALEIECKEMQNTAKMT